MECKKSKFADEKSINFYIEKLRKTSEREIKPIRGYLCQRCLHWHLTSQPDKELMLLKQYQQDIKQKNELITKLNETIHELKERIKKNNNA